MNDGLMDWMEDGWIILGENNCYILLNYICIYLNLFTDDKQTQQKQSHTKKDIENILLTDVEQLQRVPDTFRHFNTLLQKSFKLIIIV